MAFAARLQALVQWMLRLAGPADAQASAAALSASASEPAPANAVVAGEEFLEEQEQGGPPEHWLERVSQAGAGPLLWIHYKGGSPPVSPRMLAAHRRTSRRPIRRALPAPRISPPASKPEAPVASEVPLESEIEVDYDAEIRLDPVRIARPDVPPPPPRRQPVKESPPQAESARPRTSTPPSAPATTSVFRDTQSESRRELELKAAARPAPVSTPRVEPEIEVPDEPAPVVRQQDSFRETDKPDSKREAHSVRDRRRTSEPAASREEEPESEAALPQRKVERGSNDWPAAPGPWPSLDGDEEDSPPRPKSDTHRFRTSEGSEDIAFALDIRTATRPAVTSFSTSRRRTSPAPSDVARRHDEIFHRPGAAESEIRWAGQTEDLWPELPPAPPDSPGEWTDMLRAWEHRRRLEEEQRGIRWSA